MGAKRKESLKSRERFKMVKGGGRSSQAGAEEPRLD